MEKLQNIWGTVSSGAASYFAQNPNAYGLILAALGALLFVGALLKWEWVLSPSNKASVMRSLFGQRGMMFIVSSLMILLGLGYFLI